MRKSARARVAALLLVIVPGLSLLASVSSSFADSRAASAMHIVALAGWLPTIAVLEHFLKRRTEVVSLLISAAATLGVVGGIVASALELAREATKSGTPQPDRVLQWIESTSNALSMLLPSALCLCGIAFLRWRVAPRAISLALTLGAILAVTQRAVHVPAQSAIADGAILAAGIGIAVQLSRIPNAWRDALLRQDQAPVADKGDSTRA